MKKILSLILAFSPCLSLVGCGGAEAIARAAGLRRTAERLMAPYAQTGDSAFKGVRG